jgi:hypothetical protein
MHQPWIEENPGALGNSPSKGRVVLDEIIFTGTIV